MAIAANFRKHPEAMALQLVLKFGRCIWHTARPTTRIGRRIRSMVAAYFKDAVKIVYPVKKTCPSWVQEATRRATKLARMVKEAQIYLDFEAPRKLNPYAAMIARSRAYRTERQRYTFAITD